MCYIKKNMSHWNELHANMKGRLTTLLEGESGGFEFCSNRTAELDTAERV